jgi:hypothetical protein
VYRERTAFSNPEFKPTTDDTDDTDKIHI